jgi:hypothetical protein
MNKLLKILLVGGVIYIAYKYIYPNFKNKTINKPNINENDDDKITFYGKDKVSYVRGYILPDNINDFPSNSVILISKPDEFIFGESPRSAIEVVLDKQKNKINYTTSQIPIKRFDADYDDVKNKFVLLKKLIS